jgi:hypothetical protein
VDSENCADAEQIARRGRGADDVKPESEPVCDDHGTDICARTDHSSDQLARRGRGRGADDIKQRRPEPRCDDHGTDVCLVNGQTIA